MKLTPNRRVRVMVDGTERGAIYRRPAPDGGAIVHLYSQGKFPPKLIKRNRRVALGDIVQVGKERVANPAPGARPVQVDAHSRNRPGEGPSPKPSRQRKGGKGRKAKPAPPAVEVLELVPPEPRKRRGKARVDNPGQPKPAKVDRRPVVKDVGDVGERDRVVLGWVGTQPRAAHSFTGRHSLAAAEGLAASPDFDGTDRMVLTVDSAYRATGRTGESPTTLRPADVEQGDRLVLCFDGRGRLVEWHHVTGPAAASLAAARAIAGSELAGGRVRLVTTVHSTYRRR